MPETRKFSIHEVREALEKHTGDKIEDLEIEDEQGNKVRGGGTSFVSPKNAAEEAAQAALRSEGPGAGQILGGK